jgi:prepilin-type N-terminal cleavage/methylation domain-containing protein
MQKKQGFTLLEMVIVLAIIGITMTIIVPSFKRTGQAPLKQFIEDFSLFMRKTALRALEKNKELKIYINLKKRLIELHEESDKDKLTGEKRFAKITQQPFAKDLVIPESIEFKNAYITTATGTKDQLAQESDDFWFFITADGIAQEVVINLIDTTPKASQGQAGLILNPFTLAVEQYNEFKKLE